MMRTRREATLPNTRSICSPTLYYLMVTLRPLANGWCQTVSEADLCMKAALCQSYHVVGSDSSGARHSLYVLERRWWMCLAYVAGRIRYSALKLDSSAYQELQVCHQDHPLAYKACIAYCTSVHSKLWYAHLSCNPHDAALQSITSQ
jgi:hypothetical protein